MSFLPSRRGFMCMASAALAAAPTLGPSNPSAASQGNPGIRTKPIKIGQIGVAHAHANKLAVYRNSPDFEVVGIVEPDASLREPASRQEAFRDLPWMTTEQLLNTPGLQAVLIETSVDDLLQNAASCISAGMHIHLDKPAGTSLPAFRDLLRQAEARQLLVQLGYMYRYNPGIVLLRQCLAKGWLGDVFSVDAVMSKVVDPAGRKPLAKYRGGMMFELGCHILDLVIAILGEPTHVDSRLLHSSTIDDGLADNTLGILQYPRATATLRAAALEVDGGSRRHLVVCGTQGTFHLQPLDRPTAQLTLDRAQGDFKKGSQTIPLPEYRRYVDDAADMAAIIRGEKSSDFSYEHDLRVQTTLLRLSQMPLNN